MMNLVRLVAESGLSKLGSGELLMMIETLVLAVQAESFVVMMVLLMMVAQASVEIESTLRAYKGCITHYFSKLSSFFRILNAL